MDVHGMVQKGFAKDELGMAQHGQRRYRDERKRDAWLRRGMVRNVIEMQRHGVVWNSMAGQRKGSDSHGSVMEKQRMAPFCLEERS